MAKKEDSKEEVATGDKAVELALGAIEKQFGKGSVMVGDHTGALDIEFFSSQCKGLDRALGGGWVRGRILEVFGPESSGKTTLCLHAIAEIQRTGGTAAFIDVEHALDPGYATSVGVNMDELILSQPDSAEQALEIVEILARSGAVQLIVVDSVAALVPMKEVEGEMGDAQMGKQANLMSQAMRKLTSPVAKANCTVIFINQIRMKIGVMFGSPETTTGGNALKFYASQRVDIRRTGGVKEGEDFIGNTVKTKVVKNKVAPPFKEHEFQIIYGKGINILQDTMTMAVDKGLIEKAGSWYSYKGERLGQGEEVVLAFLQANPDVLREITENL